MKLSKIISKPENNLREVISILNTGGMRIVAVVDESFKLLGIVTDGDIRRALLENRDMNTNVLEIMNPKPLTAQLTESKESILEKMHQENILAIPIINSDGVLSGLETIHEILQKPKIDNPIILMAGGLGKRLLPLTEDTPKPLLKVGTEPILETLIKRLSDFGFYNFYISTHYKSEMFKDYFKDGSDWEVNIDYIDEKEPLGTAGVLTLLPKNFSDLPLILMNGDLVTDLRFDSLLDNHNLANSKMTVCVVEYDFQVPYGVVEAEKSKVKRIIEKPTHKFFVNAGIYVIDPEVPGQLPESSYLDMTDLLERRINLEDGINVFPLYEKWLDIGRLSELEKAKQANGKDV